MASAPTQKADDAPSVAPDEPPHSSNVSEDASEMPDPYSQRKNSISQSLTSEDSQTVILDHPSPSETPPPEISTKADSNKTRSLNMPEDASPPKEEPTKCWICFSDETEDTPTSSEWRSPCPCALKAHESCLLDWVADLKKSGSQEGDIIHCPQCKGVIGLAEPHNYIASFVRTLERIGEKRTGTLIKASLSSTVFAFCWFHGYSTIYLVFGTEDAERFLGLDAPAGAINIVHSLLMPLIPIVLIGSRIRGIEDALWTAWVFPSFGLTVLATMNPAHYLRWPPPYSTTISYLPIICMAYRRFYGTFLRPFKLKWEAEKAGRSVGEQNVAGAQDQNLAGLEMEVGVQLEIEEEVLVEEAVDQPPNEQQQQAGDEDQPQNGEQRPNDNAPPLPNANANANPPGGQLGNGQFIVGLWTAAQTILRALVFPVVSFSMGKALTWFLPRTWIVAPGKYDKYPRGFLQSRFGRTVVGGFFFIALKDTLQLYATYQSVLATRQRRILDYQPKANKSQGS